MQLKAIYSIAFLLFLYSFCAILCMVIQDKCGCTLPFFPLGNWPAVLIMIFTSPMLFYFACKKSKTEEQSKSDDIIDQILISLVMLILIIQMVTAASSFIGGKTNFIPFLLYACINLLAGICTYYWFHINDNYTSTRRVIISTFIVTSILVSVCLSHNYCPISLFRKIEQTKELSSAVSSLYNMHYCTRFVTTESTDEAIDKLQYNKQLVRKYINNKHLTYEKIDDTHYKISWVPYLNNKEIKKAESKNLLFTHNYDNIKSPKNYVIIDVKKRP